MDGIQADRLLIIFRSMNRIESHGADYEFPRVPVHGSGGLVG